MAWSDEADNLKKNSIAAESIYNASMADITGRQASANQAYSRWAARSGNLGSAFVPGVGKYLNYIPKDGWGDFARVLSSIGVSVGEGAANWGASYLRSDEWKAAGENAAETAGTLADARNEEARALVMDQASRGLRDLNADAARMGGQLTDSAVNQANAFESGMAAAGMSGIEGGNMERNLQYGQSRADAQEQLAFDMMNSGADDYAASMAQSFSELSARKGSAMNSAWSGTLRGISSNMDADYQGTMNYMSRVMPEGADYQLLLDRMRAAAKIPEPGSA